MNAVLTKYFLIALFFALAGCAGKDFVRPSSETFQLGQTTYSQVVQQMGQPQRTGVVEKNGKEIQTIGFVYASVGGEPSEPGVTPARVQAYFFHENILVGQEFISSFKSDSSNFDDTKVSVIKKGKTTRSEVIQIFGHPTATYIEPVVKASYGEAIGYAYTTVRGGPFTGFKTFTKILRISFDENSVVSDFELMTSGTK